MTTFDDWLTAMAAAGKGGSALAGLITPAIRGLKWTLPVRLQGNYTTATLTGFVRAAPDAASPLATITVGSPTYDSGTGYTTWIASLASGTGSNSTGSLPVDGEGDGVVSLPAAFHITPSGGDEDILFGFEFKLLGKV
jgi:hypothetical protein